MIVDLPQPEVPTKATFLPLRTWMFMCLKTNSFLDSYLKSTSLSSMSPLAPVLSIFEFSAVCIWSSSWLSWISKRLAAEFLQAAVSGIKWALLPAVIPANIIAYIAVNIFSTVTSPGLSLTKTAPKKNRTPKIVNMTICDNPKKNPDALPFLIASL